MNGGAKCKNGVVRGGHGALKVMGQCHHSIERIHLSFDFNRNYAAILYRFRDIASYLSKVADCNLLHGALAGGDPGCISLRSLATEN